MTAEIAILNKNGVALAADSAVTVTVGGSVKVFPSANKIFTLSKYNPVGVMVYNASDMLGIPWETALKTYRDELSKTAHSHLEDYASDILRFLENHKGLYPAPQKESFGNSEIRAVYGGVVSTFYEEYRKVLTGQRRVPPEKPQKLLDLIVDANYRKAKTMPPFENADGTPWTDGVVRDIEKEYLPAIRKIRDEVFSGIELTPQQKRQLTELAKLALSRAVGATGYTGLVVAGYGAGEYCPSVAAFEVYGNLGGTLRFVHNKTKNAKIGASSGAAIVPFAQSEMVMTFMEGVDPSYQRTINNAVQTAIKATAEALIGTPEEVDTERSTTVSNIVISVMHELNETLSQERWKHFVNPVLSIVGSLPKIELASMAESLVNLTSLKRHVSSASETVGGPIDVALISKGDGFVWVKRKHYFDKDLNYHFFANYFREKNADET